jgi:CCR4-NOT transcription complex subunit 1
LSIFKNDWTLNIFIFSGIAAETKETFLKSLRRDFPRELVPVVLAPLLYSSKGDLPMDKINQDSSTMTNTMVCLSICENIFSVLYY